MPTKCRRLAWGPRYRAARGTDNHLRLVLVVRVAGGLGAVVQGAGLGDGLIDQAGKVLAAALRKEAGDVVDEDANAQIGPAARDGVSGDYHVLAA